jgi:hypothetical protein
MSKKSPHQRVRVRSGHALNDRPAPRHPARSSFGAEALERRFLFATTFWVTSTADSGVGSLRQAITNADQTSGSSVIDFAIASGAGTITPLSQLPSLNTDITIDGTSQQGYAGTPLITINGSVAAAWSYGIVVSGGGCSIVGLAIDNFGSSGLYLGGTGGDNVQADYIGVSPTGASAAANGGDGILVTSPDDLIGGASSADRNIISGNGQQGVMLYASAATGDMVEGNFIGTNAAGNTAIPNYLCGVCVYGANNNTIGGTGGGDGNVISGNGNDGIVILGGASGSVVAGNLMGTDASGAYSVPNSFYGIEVDSGDNLVGGLTSGARNIISGNDQAGVVLYQPESVGNVVEGNYIGTDITGTQSIGTQPDGVDIDAASDNTIGGTSIAACNVISGNLDHGVYLGNNSTGNTVSGDYIGTTASGMSALGNGLVDEGGLGPGVLVDATAEGNTIGGITPGAANLISGNGSGIILFDAPGSDPGNIVQANLIGASAVGQGSLANVGDGILIFGDDNTIGGPSSADANFIFGNAANAIVLSSGTGNVIEGNVTSLTSVPATISTTTQLTGTPSANTTSSYDGQTSDNYTAAFDGNSNTYFDAPTANGNWVQLDLGSPQTITEIAYAPRPYFEPRMVGGIIEASNDPTFSTGVVTLYTVTGIPTDGLTNQSVSTAGKYEYLRYASPAGSYGNIGEMQVFGPGLTGGPVGTETSTGTGTSSTKTPVKLIPTAASASNTGSYDGSSSDTYAAVFDGNTNTYWDSPNSNGNWVQENLGFAQTISEIAYAPRAGFEYRMVGGIFETSNDPTFTTGVVTLYTITSTPSDGLTTQAVSAGGAYQYVRYVAPSGSYGNIAGMQVFGPGSNSGTVSGTGALGTTPTTTSSQLIPLSESGTTGSYHGLSGDTYSAVFDGNIYTYFDAPTANGNYVQANLGAAHTITSISYAPRVGFEYRMIGGYFEASNDPTFSTGVVTLYTIPSTRNDGLTNVTVSVTGTYQYLRYIAPPGSYGNIAEMRIFGY